MGYGRGIDSSSLNPTHLALIMFATTIAVVIALFIAGILPLWLAAAILVADGALTYVFFERLGRAT